MVAARAKSHLGTGIYTVSEAAVYARVQPSLMARWLFTKQDSLRVIEPQYGRDERIISFRDWVQTLAIRELRMMHKIPLERFREAIETARTSLGFEHPFARRHCTFFDTRIGELVIHPPDRQDLFVQASGKQRGQTLVPCKTIYQEFLEFDDAGLAKVYKPYTYKFRNKQPVSISMDPEIRFGEPLLPSGYTALTIAQAVVTEGGSERVAKLYGIPIEEIETAFRFRIEYLGLSA